MIIAIEQISSKEIIKIKKGKIINFFLLEKFKIVNILFINCTLD